MEQNLATAQWYVLQAMSGQENKVFNSLTTRIEQDRLAGIDNGIEELVIPTEKVEERRNNKKVVRERKLYPGYLLIKVCLYRGDGELEPMAWRTINETQGVIGFVGGSTPTPLPPDDVALMLKQKEEEEKPAIIYQVGETVIIRDGAFEGYEGIIESIDSVRQRLKVSASIFGRSTPIEVEIWQVERPS